MKKFRRIIAILLCMIFIFSYSPIAFAEVINDDNAELITGAFANNRVLVVMTNEASLMFKDYSANDFAEFECASVSNLSSASGAKVEAFVNSEKNPDAKTADLQLGGVISPSDYHQILCLELANRGENYVVSAIKSLLERDDVLFAEPDYVLSMASVTPNDAEYSLQTAASIIDLPEAWALTTGSADVVVGVIDSGIYGNHVDLAANVDFESSLDLRSGNAIPDKPPTDTNHHGSHVAGIIGAVGNNNKGIAGVCWDVTMVSLKVFDADGNGLASSVILAINSADGLGISVLNFSGAYADGNKYYNDNGGTMRYAIQNYSGLFVCAAGNENTNNDNVMIYPAAYNDLKNVITVGSSTMSDTRSSYSNYGKTKVDLFAPGDNIRSTGNSNDYFNSSGTSMAAPFVTGTAALLLARDSQLLPCELKDIIMSSVDDCGSTFDNECVSGGRLNVYSALLSSSQHASTCVNRNNGSHMRTCTTCGCAAIRPHDYENVYKYNATKHRLACDCGASSYESHKWNGSRTKCLVCGYDTSGLGTID